MEDDLAHFGISGEYGLPLRTNGGTRNTFSAKSGYGLNLNGSTLLFDIARGTDATSDLTVSAILSSGGGITKQGNGILTLTGNNTYTGSTTVNSGALFVNGSTAEATVSVDSGATLGGNGSIGGVITVQSGGILPPGSAVVTLTTGSSVAIGGHLAIGINGPGMQ